MSIWEEIELLVGASQEFVLTDDERKMVADAEQSAFESNYEAIKIILDKTEQKITTLGFWVENVLSKEGLRFRFNFPGYYGPGGISSQFHISGPLVLGEINPAGDPIASFYINDIDLCHKIGHDFEKGAFEVYLTNVIKKYLMPENLITSKEQYEHFRNILKN
ncbi:MAG: hypothetical protein JKY55_15425 [Aliivibrio sp.]|uniref:hypothetical protein n=1 Tax=Aliivibrio sp. TaxID=1872443 RepID=UPI001A41B9F2|nr:hypothetical protein [Aliivibrio sp.]